MKYDNKVHDISIADLAEVYSKEILQELQAKTKVMSYDSSIVGNEFVESRQTVRTGGSFSTINPLERDLVTVIVDTELKKGVVVMHDPHYRHIIRDTVTSLNNQYRMDFQTIYERKLKSEFYFSRS
ncbi:MAG: hypothetical protein ACP5OA_04095 [Candidatus Woesearchaeota archaeon]